MKKRPARSFAIKISTLLTFAEKRARQEESARTLLLAQRPYQSYLLLVRDTNKLTRSNLKAIDETTFIRAYMSMGLTFQEQFGWWCKQALIFRTHSYSSMSHKWHPTDLYRLCVRGPHPALFQTILTWMEHEGFLSSE